MKMPPAIDTENKPSKLLNSEENQQIFRLLGNRCLAISTAVVELYITEPPHHSQWTKRDTGVLCFVKDNMKKNYFFRLFCLRRNSIIWEQELYNSLEYIESTSFLHIFEGENVLIAFNYASIDEARDLKNSVDIKVMSKKKRDERRRHNRNSNDFNSNKTNLHDVVNKNTNAVIKSARKRNLTKADIGEPSDFKHVSHVGWNPDNGFDIDVKDEQLRNFFAKAGVSEKQLQDKDTREFIYDFINKHGGPEAMVATSDAETNPEIPPPLFPGPPVPPVPPRGSNNNKPHVRAAPPPPPSSTNFSRPPAKIHEEKPRESHLRTDSIHSAPPPPPLPVDLPPMENITNSSAPAGLELGTALLQSIRAGKTLKPVDDDRVAPVVETRNDLLCEIRKGYCLKPVQEREVKPQVEEVSADRGLAGALARALALRNEAIHPDDDDDENDDSNDDEWDC